jgi:galacturan 1,4-alpha-galacturonidase
MVQYARFIAVLASIINAVDGSLDRSPVLTRPAIEAWPLSPGRTHTVSPGRNPNRFCFVERSSKSSDDAANILKAFRNCNHGGTVVLDKNYTIESPLDLTFLHSIDVAITGTVSFTPNISYWLENSFKYAYQDASAMWRFGGEDVNIYGNGVGVINGNGQPWYDGLAANSSLQRPVLFVVDGLHGGSVTGLHMVNPPSVSLVRETNEKKLSADYRIVV